MTGSSHPPRRAPARVALTMFAAIVLTAGFGTSVASAATSPSPTPSVQAGYGPGLLPSPSSISIDSAGTCARTAYKAGFSFDNYISTAIGSEREITVAVAVAMAESGCNPGAVFVNPNGCRDRGLWQIDDCAWPQVSDACAFDAQCNGNAAWGLISNHGSNWSPWSTFNSGAWESYVGSANSAIGSLTVTLSSKGAGTCLDAKAQTPHDGGVIQQWRCDSSDPYQQWRVIQGSPSENPVLQNVGDGFCLDAQAQTAGDGGVIQQWDCNTTLDRYQRWSVQGSGELDTEGHAELLLKNTGAGTCLDAQSQSVGDGGVIQQWTCHSGDTYQQWD